MKTVFPGLSKPQIKLLAQYSVGMVLAGRCGLCCVAFALAEWLDEKFDAVRERLRDWYCGASDKSGRKRRELNVESCFAPLLAWVLKDWSGRDLPIALDATALGQRFVVLAISVVYRACAIPVAWVVLPARAKGSWKPHWLGLLEKFKEVVPPRMRVIVLTDRGLYAKWMFQAIVALGWHPFLRINTANADFKPQGASEYVPTASLLAGVGSRYNASGVMFRSRKTSLSCTLLAHWSPGYEQGWFVLTDLPPEQADSAWYGLRCWIERGFKHTKSGGWNWQDTRMTDPHRATRLWLAMAVAAMLVMHQGAVESINDPCEKQADRLTPRPAASTKRREPAETKTAVMPRTHATSAAAPHRRRILSVFRTGLLVMQSILLGSLPLPHCRFIPEPWPHFSTSTPNPAATDQPP